MRTVFRIVAVMAAVFFASCIFGTITAASIVPAWKVNLPDDMRVSGITISDDGSRVFVGGNLLMVLSGDGRLLWGGYNGAVAAMSGNGKYVVTAMGETLRLLDKDGTLIWTRTGGAPITNVAISNTGSVIVSDDSRGYLRTFNVAGESFGTARLEPAKNIAISPAGDLIVIATDSGLRYINPGLDLLWSDNRSGGLETFIAISIDGSTIYTAGGNRVSSHTRTGALNWQKDVTSEHITDMASSESGNVLVLGSQDTFVYVLDNEGYTRKKFPTGQWVNAVSISRDGTMVAAGSIDRYLTIFFRNGVQIGKVRTDRIIQPRSVAINPDNNRIVVGDELFVYGYTLEPDSGFVDETATPRMTAIRTPQVTTDLIISTTTTEQPVPELSGTAGSPVTAATTKKSPVSIIAGLCAITIMMVILRRSD